MSCCNHVAPEGAYDDDDDCARAASAYDDGADDGVDSVLRVGDAVSPRCDASETYRGASDELDVVASDEEAAGVAIAKLLGE